MEIYSEDLVDRIVMQITKGFATDFGESHDDVMMSAQQSLNELASELYNNQKTKLRIVGGTDAKIKQGD